MKVSEILTWRLRNTGLSHSPFNHARDAVAHLGAVQAQDFTAAKWALGIRVKNSGSEDIEQAYNDGEILRTHVMRPRWHFILPEDIGWMLDLTAPRVKSFLTRSNLKIGLDDVLFEKSNTLIARALGEPRLQTGRPTLDQRVQRSLPLPGGQAPHQRMELRQKRLS